MYLLGKRFFYKTFEYEYNDQISDRIYCKYNVMSDPGPGDVFKIY